MNARAAPPMPDDQSELDLFQGRIGHRFRNAALLEQSLNHPSIQQDKAGAPHNQRLEFLGDAVLQLVISEKLHALFPEEREGALTRQRATLTRGGFISSIARQLGVDRVLQVSTAERGAGGHERDAALEDATEALVAAVYLDSDWDTVRRVVLGWYGDIENSLGQFQTSLNPKGQLQELVQPNHGNSALTYRTVRTYGPPHARMFEIEVLFNDRPLGSGSGSSKKEAEEAAAREALKNWPPAES